MWESYRTKKLITRLSIRLVIISNVINALLFFLITSFKDFTPPNDKRDTIFTMVKIKILGLVVNSPEAISSKRIIIPITI